MQSEGCTVRKTTKKPNGKIRLALPPECAARDVLSEWVGSFHERLESIDRRLGLLLADAGIDEDKV